MEFLKKRFFIILLCSAVWVGLIHVAPTLYVLFRSGSEYKGIFPLQSSDEEHYDVNIKMAMGGYYRHQNNYLFEGWNDRTGGKFPFKSENILGFIGGKLGFSLGSWIFLMRFLFPAFAFLLVFSLFRSLNLPPFHALFWSFLNLLSPYLVYGWVDVLSRPFFTVLRDRGINALWYEQYGIAALPWARTVNPQFSGLFFLCAMIFLVQIIKGNKPWFWVIPSLAFFYVNFRLYFYFWSALGAVLFLAFILSLVFHNKKALFPLGVILALCLVGGLSYILKLLRSSAPWAYSHFPISSPGILFALILLLLGIVILKRFPLSSWDRVIFFAAPLVAIVTMNQNVLTGRIVQPWHYELFTTPLLVSLAAALLINRANLFPRLCDILRQKIGGNIRLSLLLHFLVLFLFFQGLVILFFYYFKLSPNFQDPLLYISTAAVCLFILTFLATVFFFMPRFPSLGREHLILGAGGILLFAIFMEAFNRQAFVSMRIYQDARQNQYLAAPFEWLRKNTPPHSAVLASFMVSEQIPLFTHNTVYLCKNAYYEYTPSQKDRWERAVNYFILTGYDEPDFRKTLSVWPYGSLFWGMSYLEPKMDLYSFNRGPLVSGETLNRLLDLFREKKNKERTKLIKEYSLDYIFWGPEERKFFKIQPSRMPSLSKVYEDSTPVEIYRILPGNNY